MRRIRTSRVAGGLDLTVLRLVLRITIRISLLARLSIGLSLFTGIALAQTVAFENVTVLPMKGQDVLTNQLVVIRNQRIAFIGPNSPDKIPAGALRLDGTGKFLLPGFIDSYAHIHEKSLIPFVANGVTTVRNAPGTHYQLGIKNSVDGGQMIGPRIISLGVPIAGFPTDFHSQGAIRNGDDARFAVREVKRLGYDGVFIYTSIGPAAYFAVLDEAKKLGMKVQGHYPYKVPRSMFFAGEQESIENMVALVDFRSGNLDYPEQFFPDFAGRMAAAKKYVIPTLNVHRMRSLADKTDQLLARPEMNYVPPRQKAYWNLRQGSVFAVSGYQYRGAPAAVKILREKGVRVLVGSDAGYPLIAHGFSYVDELQNLVETGMSNLAVLRAGTIEAADFLGLGSEIGSIELGKTADLVLLDANPLSDIRNANKIAGVSLRGVWYDRPKIDQMLEELAVGLKNLAKDRWVGFDDPSRNGFRRVASYEFLVRGVVAGEERLYSQEEKDGSRTLLSHNSIDPHNFRKTVTVYELDKGLVNQVSVDRTAPEGKTTLNLRRSANSGRIVGDIAIYGRLSRNEHLPPDWLILGPTTSNNIDIDVIANYQLILDRFASLPPSTTAAVTAKKPELNPEEWGRDSVIGDVEYLVTRLADKEIDGPVKSMLKQFEIFHTGFNGGASNTQAGFRLIVTVDPDGFIRSIDVDPESGVLKIVRK